jgi:small subunit ribosomal protein S6
MRQYEFVFVIQPTLEDDDVNGIVGQIEGLIQRGGGEILSRGQLVDRKGHIGEGTDSWTKRRLAYSIGTHTEGYYAALVFRAPSEVISQIEQNARINENVLRYLTIRTEE